jgi:hypothetical protein
MSPFDEFDRRLELIIREFTMRILVPRWSEFDAVWESANKVCDRYELRNGAPPIDPDTTHSDILRNIHTSAS